MDKRKLLISITAGILAAIMVLSLVMSILPATVSAASSSEIKKQINKMKEQQTALKDQMKEAQDQYEKNEDEIVDLINRKLLIDQEIFLLYEQINLINQQLSAYSLLIADKQDELDEAQDRMNALSDKNRDRIRAMEEDGGLSYWSVLFRASSFSDLLDRLNMIEEIAASDQRRLKEMRDAAEVVEAARQALFVEKSEIDKTKDELDEADAVLQEKNAAAQALLDELVARGVELKELYAQYEEEEKDLMAEIAMKEQEYLEAKELEWIAYMATYTTPPPPTTVPPTTAATESPATEPSQTPETEGTQPENGGSSEATTAPTENQEPAPTDNTEATQPPVQNTEPSNEATQPPTEATQPPTEATQPPTEETKPKEEKPATNPDPWRVPCSYTRLTSPFGERESPTEGASTNHQGVDLAGPEGTPIYASRGGTVTIAKFSNSAGYYVTINHGDGFSSVYMHMTHFVVSKGDKVNGGDVIGYMGSTGISTGSHLHFSILYKGVYVNPANYVYLHP